jgi:carbon starvation protein CstA
VVKRPTGHRWLLLVPFAWQAGLAPLVNDVAARPFGLPFPMAWQMAGILLTSVVIGLVYAIDRRRGLPDDEP